MLRANVAISKFPLGGPCIHSLNFLHCQLSFYHPIKADNRAVFRLKSHSLLMCLQLFRDTVCVPNKKTVSSKRLTKPTFCLFSHAVKMPFIFYPEFPCHRYSYNTLAFLSPGNIFSIRCEPYGKVRGESAMR